MQPLFLYKCHSLIFIELTLLLIVCSELDFPDSSADQESICDAGDLGSIPGSGRSPGEGNGNSLQYSCLENPMDRGAWWATVHGATKSQTRLSDFPFMHWRRKWQPFQCSCLENPRDGGVWWAAVYGVAQSWTRLKRLSSSSSRGL